MVDRGFSLKMMTVVGALVGSSVVLADFAEARSGRGFSSGSRGSKTFTAPKATPTAPTTAPIQRSTSQTGSPSPIAGAATGASRWGGMRGLLLGGLLGAGLASMFGLGGGFAAFLGFALQMLLIGGLVMLAISFFRNRAGSAIAQPALAGAASGAGRGPDPRGNAAYRSGMVDGSGAATTELAIAGDDFNAFERLLKEIQLAYANADLKQLGDRVTPEMLAQFAGELDENRRRGVSNDLSEPKLLKGDLSEAWSESSGDYATVAMRYEIIDALVEQSTGRVLQGSTTEPQEVTEIWTFHRPLRGTTGQWKLSAVQQA